MKCINVMSDSKEIIKNLAHDFKESTSIDSMGYLNAVFEPKSDLSDEKKTTDSDQIEKVSRDKDEFTNIIAKPDKDGDNLLFLAIILKQAHIALLMIDLISDYKILSRYNNYFQSALHLAVLINECRLVRRLVIAGAKVSLRDWRGDTPLHIACKKGLFSVAEALLKPIKHFETKMNLYDVPYQQIPQNLEIRNVDGLTCFLIATYNRYQSIMELLLKHGADINAVDMKSGKSSLHIVAERGDVTLVNYLISVTGLKIDLKTYSGYTALQFARMRNQRHVEYRLLCYGAQDIDDLTNSTESDLDSDSEDERFLSI